MRSSTRVHGLSGELIAFLGSDKLSLLTALEVGTAYAIGTVSFICSTESIQSPITLRFAKKADFS
jgi:hypothetical protein